MSQHPTKKCAGYVSPILYIYIFLVTVDFIHIHIIDAVKTTQFINSALPQKHSYKNLRMKLSSMAAFSTSFDNHEGIVQKKSKKSYRLKPLQRKHYSDL